MTNFTWQRLVVFLGLYPTFLLAAGESESLLMDNERSAMSRRMSSLGSRSTYPSQPIIKRASYPQTDHPHVCLAFLSCCQRTDLLNHTLAGVIRHMEEDEPDYLKYEIAWVDNGSDADLTAQIADSYEIEHVLTLPKNMGLAYGMNLLVHNLCQAPYILLLEEDWLYLDELVATQTPERKRSIATSVSLIENMGRNEIKAFDGRTVMGVFLRPESYESFLRFPHMDNWETQSQINLPQELHRATRQGGDEAEEECDNEETDVDSDKIVDIDYRIFCGDPSIQKESIWGSYTNGAGLYRRSDLIAIGRMYGEPGDAFHDRYVEGNYAYRASVRNCHAGLRLTDDRTCTSIYKTDCSGAFHHIGGGRGTRPMNARGTVCDDLAWNFYGTPLYDKYHKYVEQTTGQRVEICTKEELEQLRQRKFRDADAEEYRQKVKETNEEVFAREQEERDIMRQQAHGILMFLKAEPERLRAEVPFLADKTDDEIRSMAERILSLADSPHPIEGFWDSHGRLVEEESKQ